MLGVGASDVWLVVSVQVVLAENEVLLHVNGPRCCCVSKPMSEGCAKIFVFRGPSNHLVRSLKLCMSRLEHVEKSGVEHGSAEVW